MDFTFSSPNSGAEETRQVVVVGAGAAGLAAAYDLQKKGFDVVVLEANDYPGGRIRTVHSHGYHAESGASVVTDQEAETMGLLQELSVGPLIDLGLHGTDLFFGRRMVHLTRIDGKITSPRDAWSLLSFAAAMATSGNGFHFPHPSLLGGYRAALKAIQEEQAFLDYPYDPAARPNWDTSTFAEFLNQFHPELQPLVDLQLKVTAGEVSDRISLFWGLVTFNWNVDGKFYWFDGGASKFPLALAKKLGERLRLNCRVESVSADGVIRASQGGESGESGVRASAVILAVPPSVALRVTEGLSERKREAMAGVQFGSYIVVHFICRKRFWTSKIKAGYLNAATTVFADILDSTKGQAGKGGILSCFVAGPEARRLIDSPDSTVLCEVIRDLERVFPGAIHETIDCSITRWREAIPYFHAGYGEIIRELKQPEGRFFFCGDYTQGAGIQDAVVSGLRAADEVAKFLSTKS